MQITGTVIVGGSMYAEWFKLEPVFEIGSLNSQGYLLIGLFTTNLQMMVQSNLGIRNFLVALKLFLNAKSSLSL